MDVIQDLSQPTTVKPVQALLEKTDLDPTKVEALYFYLIRNTVTIRTNHHTFIRMKRLKDISIS